jgi:hypothetical protein
MGKLTQEQIANALKATPSTSKKKLSLDDTDVSVSLDEVDAFGNKESIKEMYTSIASYNKMYIC